MRACVACGSEAGLVLQYVERLGENEWAPFLAHERCAGTSSTIAPRPPARSRLRVKVTPVPKRLRIKVRPAW